jgi:hypothetical protein
MRQLTRDEARQIANTIAKIPDLLVQPAESRCLWTYPAPSADPWPLPARLCSPRGLLHECVDEQRYDSGRQNDHPISDWKARY